ncbi:MAG: recombinase family protein [Pseudomonadota bacterium]
MTRQVDILGSARVSTVGRDLTGQVAGLEEASVIRVFEDVGSDKEFDHPGLSALIDHARPRDSLAITRLDRLGRSLKELLETVENLKTREHRDESRDVRLSTQKQSWHCKTSFRPEGPPDNSASHGQQLAD